MDIANFSNVIPFARVERTTKTNNEAEHLALMARFLACSFDYRANPPARDGLIYASGILQGLGQTFALLGREAAGAELQKISTTLYTALLNPRIDVPALMRDAIHILETGRAPIDHISQYQPGLFE